MDVNKIKLLSNEELLALKLYKEYKIFKFAMHLIRLMLEGKELLTTGQLVFPLKGAGLLKQIRQGEIPIEDVLALSEKLEKEIEDITEYSGLPSKPRFKEIEELTIQLVKQSL